jgi:hypothetical protein
MAWKRVYNSLWKKGDECSLWQNGKFELSILAHEVYSSFDKSDLRKVWHVELRKWDNRRKDRVRRLHIEEFDSKDKAMNVFKNLMNAYE